MAKTMIFYRCVKKLTQPFYGLYGVEKLYVKDNTIYKKELVHEWDNRIISEAILARLGGDSAFEAYKEDNGEPEDAVEIEGAEPVEARNKEDFKNLTVRKLNKELRGKS